MRKPTGCSRLTATRHEYKSEIYAAAYAAAYVSQHRQMMLEGRGTPDEQQSDSFAEEADAIAESALTAWERRVEL